MERAKQLQPLLRKSYSTSMEPETQHSKATSEERRMPWQHASDNLTTMRKKRSRMQQLTTGFVAAALVVAASAPASVEAFVTGPPGKVARSRIRARKQQSVQPGFMHPFVASRKSDLLQRGKGPQQHCWRLYFTTNGDGEKEEKSLASSFDGDEDDDLSDEEFLRRELARLEALEGVVEDIEEYCDIEGMCDDDDDDDEASDGFDDDDDDFDEVQLNDLDKLDELFSLLEDADSDLDDEEDGDEEDFDDLMSFAPQSGVPSELEKALLQGVVPVDAEVGRDTIPGDWGFDPWNMADKDYIQQLQYRFLTLLPGGNPNNDPPPEPRPAALVLRDYREAEIRHGRLAMLAVFFWPLQEKLDQLLLDKDQFGPIIYGPVTLPYFPLLMTLIMMLLGYLDIYAKAIQEQDDIGDAFLPGDCFWDPLKILEGAPPSMKRNMQEREITNGRMAMIAFAAFVFEEATSHRALIEIPSNELLFEPAYQVPFIQEWLDLQFG